MGWVISESKQMQYSLLQSDSELLFKQTTVDSRHLNFAYLE